MSMPDVQVFEFLSLENAMNAIESFSKEGFEVSIKPVYRMNVWTSKAEIDKYEIYVGENNRLTTECLYNMKYEKENQMSNKGWEIIEFIAYLIVTYAMAFYAYKIMH